jgi:hypothetical protein
MVIDTSVTEIFEWKLGQTACGSLRCDGATFNLGQKFQESG